MTIRPAGDGDLPAIARIAAANDEQGPGTGSDPRYVAHLRRHGRFLVADAGGAVAGYCATRQLGVATMLCDLFVDPARQGAGLGGRLLGAIFEGNADCAARFTFASRDPRAMPLYVRHRMIPRWPLLYLSGPAGLGRGPARLAWQKVPAADAATAELHLTGMDRAADYAYWAGLSGSTGLIVQDGETVAAAGVSWPGRLVHLVSAADCDPAATLATALSALGTGRVRLCLPAPHPALPLLLAARWRIDDLDQHMSTADGLLHPSHVLSAALA